MTDFLPAAVAIGGLWAAARRLGHVGFVPLPFRRRPPAWVLPAGAGHDEMVRALRGKLLRLLRVGPLDWSRPIGDIRRDLWRVAKHMLNTHDPVMDGCERDRVIDAVVAGITAPATAA